MSKPGFSGVLAYSLREATWLVRNGITDDAVMGYPTVDRGGLADLLGDEEARGRVTLMVDDPAHLSLIEAAAPSGATPRVAIDIDAGLKMGRSHVGPKRSPLYDAAEVVDLARDIVARGFSLVGVMTYEGQVAGVPDDVPHQRAKSLVVRKLKSASIAELEERRAQIVAQLKGLTDLEFWTPAGPGASSRRFPTGGHRGRGRVGAARPGLFDHYLSFEPRPAAFFGVPVVRRPTDGVVTVAGGGFIASGPSGKDRAPLPWAPPDLHLTGLEGAGEVQTPLTGSGAHLLQIGDWVWFRHAKSGELAEHTNQVHLLTGEEVAETVPSYRGLGLAW